MSVSTGEQPIERRARPRPPRESRRQAREAALQMLYQWEVGHTSIAEVVQTFWTIGPAADTPLSPPLQAFAVTLARGVVEHLEGIDPYLTASAEHWRLSRMAVMDRLILRVAVYEFLFERTTPPKVVINEALELARTFSTDNAVRFINGILDAIRRKLDDEDDAR